MSVDLVAAGQEDGSGDQEPEQRQHFDQRRPELELAEQRHRDHVHAEHQRQGDQRDEPLGHGVEHLPEPGVGGDRGGVDDGGHGPVEEVHPPGDVGGLLAQELPGVGDERSRRRPVQHQFAHRAQDEEDEYAADGVDAEQSWPRRVQPAAGAHEQAGSDGSADGDHL